MRDHLSKGYKSSAQEWWVKASRHLLLLLDETVRVRRKPANRTLLSDRNTPTNVQTARARCALGNLIFLHCSLTQHPLSLLENTTTELLPTAAAPGVAFQQDVCSQSLPHFTPAAFPQLHREKPSPGDEKHSPGRGTRTGP